jgi:hypothetical protein
VTPTEGLAVGRRVELEGCGVVGAEGTEEGTPEGATDGRGLVSIEGAAEGDSDGSAVGW